MKQSKIAITGGIGSGKSTVSEIVKSLGFQVLSADEEYKNVLLDPSVLQRIEQSFHCVENGVLNRKMLSAIVFSDPAKLKLLNSITHPEIMKSISSKMTEEISFAEIPLLFEGRYENTFDQVIVVVRDKEQRILSVMKRNGITREEVISRMENQFDYDGADLNRFFVIENSSSIEELKEKVKTTISKIKRSLE